LLGGGNVLGMAITSSNLLSQMADIIIKMLPYSDPWTTLVIVLFFCLVVSTFVSHTVASLILMPIIAEVGLQLGKPKMFVIGAAFAVSGGMALPFSSFPNVNSMLIVDDFQKPYLSTSDFMKSGGLMSILTVLLTATLGYILIQQVM
jgi:phosphate transporter